MKRERDGVCVYIGYRVSTKEIENLEKLFKERKAIGIHDIQFCRKNMKYITTTNCMHMPYIKSVVNLVPNRH